MIPNLSERGSPVNPDNLYCSVEDVKRFTRGELTNLSDNDVEKMIEEKTRYAEKNMKTAFRKMDVNDVVMPLNLSDAQKRENLSSRFKVRERRVGIHIGTNDRWIDVVLPNDRIDTIDKVELITDDTVDITNQDPENWRLTDPRSGEFQIDHLSLDQTLSGKASENKYKNPKLRISYQYGRDSVEPDIRDAIAKLVAYELINSDAFGQIRSDDDSGFIDLETASQDWKESGEKVIQSYA